jgi:hypothetical protein
VPTVASTTIEHRRLFLHPSTGQQYGQSCIQKGQTCTRFGTPCCDPYTCKGAFPNTTCQ